MRVFITALILSITVFLRFAQAIDPPTLRIMTYNIHHCEGTDGKLDIPRIAEIIRKSEADLVALQEVDRQTSRSNHVDQLNELSKLTGLHGYFGKAIDFGGGEYGVGILSRYPAQSEKLLKLPSDSTREQRVALHIAIQPKSQPVLNFVCTHLDHSGGENDRSEQIAELVRNFGELPEQTILAGDFNTTTTKPELVPILKRWVDVDVDKLAPTIPTVNPNRKIDFIFLQLDSPWEVASAQVLDEPVASDHLPLVATLKLKK